MLPVRPGISSLASYCFHPRGISPERRLIIGFLEEFNAEGKTIVMVTHDPRAAQRAKRTLRLQNGAVISQVAGEAGSWQPDSAVA